MGNQEIPIPHKCQAFGQKVPHKELNALLVPVQPEPKNDLLCALGVSAVKILF